MYNTISIDNFLGKHPNYPVLPPIHTNIQNLPLKDIPWEFFERLCVKLTIKNPEFINPSIFGVKGDKQYGIDIFARLKDKQNRYATFQCKKVEKFGVSELRAAVKKFLEGDFKYKSDKFIIYTSFHCRRAKLLSEIEKIKDEFLAQGMQFEVWDDVRISDELKNYPDLVYDFFNKEWLSLFIGKELAERFFVENIDYKIIDETEKRIIDPPEFYIERKVIEPKDEKQLNEYFLYNTKFKDLYDVLDEPVRIALVAEAANGKSIEMQYIAHLISNDSSKLFPIFYSLGDYTGEKISEIIPDYYTKLPVENLIFILDGFDEIPTEDRIKFKKRLRRYITSNPKANFIVSARENFYTNDENNNTSTLENFKRYNLAKLTGEQVLVYLEQKLNPGQKSTFDTQIHVKNLEDLVYIPFYLIKLVDHFENHNSLPDRKAQIFETLVDESFNFDNEHFEAQELEHHKLSIVKALTKIALVMEASEKQKLSELELQEIIGDADLRLLLRHSSILRKSNSQYEFLHNNFREFLCAKELSTKDFVDIKPFLFIGDNINQKRVNVLSFLFSILDKDTELFNQLFSNIQSNDYNILVKIERDKLTTEQRFEIFKNIFNNFKDKRIFINRDVYNHRQLAYFAESELSAKFLLNEIRVTEVLHSKYNAIELLGYFNNTKSIFEVIKATFIEEIPKGDKYLIFNTLLALGNLKLNDKKTIDTILGMIQDRGEDYVLAGLYYFLIESDYLDEYLDVFLKAIPTFRYVWSPNSENDSEVRIGDERIYLVNGLESMTKPDALKKLLHYFTHNPRDMRDIYFHRFYRITKALSIEIQKDSSLANSVLDLILSLEKEYVEGEELRMLYELIESSGLNLKAFNYIAQSNGDEHSKEDALARLANKQIIDELLSKFDKSEVDAEHIKNYLLNVRWKNNSHFDELYSYANEKSNNSFVIEFRKSVDYEALRKQGFENYLKLLFDREAYLEHLKSLVNQIGKEDFTRKDITNLISDLFEKELPTDIVLEQLNRDIHTKNIPTNLIMHFYENLDWDRHIIDTVFQNMSNRKECILTIEQKDFIEQWCLDNLDIDFKHCLVTEGNQYFTCDPRSVYIWYYLRHLNLSYKKNILLDLLSFDWIEKHNWIGIEYLETLLPLNEIKERIIENIKSGTENKIALQNQIEYCKRRDVKEIVQYLIPIIADNSSNEFLRKHAYEAYIKLSDTFDELLNILPSLDNTKWDILDLIYKTERGGAEVQLLQIFETGTEDDKYCAAAFLVLYNNLEAFQFIVETIKNANAKKPFKWSLEYSPFKVISSPLFLPELIKLLEIVYKPDFKDNEYSSLKMILLNVFQRIALNNDDSTFETTISLLKKFIQDHAGDNPSINFIYRTIDDIELQHKINKGDTMNLRKSILLAEEIIQ